MSLEVRIESKHSLKSSEGQVSPKAAVGNDQATCRRGGTVLIKEHGSPSFLGGDGSGWGSKGSSGGQQTSGWGSKDAPAGPPAAVLQARKTWREVKDRHQELASLTGHFSEHVGRLSDRRADGLVRKVQPELRQELERAAADKTSSRAVTRCGIGPEDPSYEHVVQLEEVLAVCTARTARLRRICEEYYEDAEACRVRVEALLANNGPLAATARRALKRNQLVESALEPLSARGMGASLSDCLSELLPPPSRGTHGRAARGDLSARSIPRVSITSSIPVTPIASVALTSPVDPAVPAASSGSANSAAKEAAQRIISGGIASARGRLEDKGGDRLAQEVRANLGLDRKAMFKKQASGVLRGAATAAVSIAGYSKKRLARKRGSSEEEEEYLCEIEHLEERLAQAQWLRRQASAASAEKVVHRGGLEEFFLQCMHDFRQGAARQRGLWMSTPREGGFGSGSGDIAATSSSSGSAWGARPNSSWSTGGAGSGAGGAAVGTVGAEELHSARRKREELAAEKPGDFSAKLASVTFQKVFRAMSESDELQMHLYEKLFPHRQAFYARKQKARSIGGRAKQDTGMLGLSALIEPAGEYKPPWDLANKDPYRSLRAKNTVIAY